MEYWSEGVLGRMIQEPPTGDPDLYHYSLTPFTPNYAWLAVEQTSKSKV